MKFNPLNVCLGFSGEPKFDKIKSIEIQQAPPDIDSERHVVVSIATSRLDCEVTARRDHSSRAKCPVYHSSPKHNETPVLPHKIVVKGDYLDFSLLHEIDSQVKQVEKFVKLLTERYESLLHGHFASSFVRNTMVERPRSAAFFIITSAALNPERPNEAGALKNVLQSKELKDLVDNLVRNESLLALSEAGEDQLAVLEAIVQKLNLTSELSWDADLILAAFSSFTHQRHNPDSTQGEVCLELTNTIKSFSAK